MSPKRILRKIIDGNDEKIKLSIIQMLLLGFLAGVYISFGSLLSIVVTLDLQEYLGLGFTRFLAGSVFTIGLVLVVVGGAELFTGNCLMFTSVLAKRIAISKMLRNWFFVYLANFIGSLFMVALIYYSGLWNLGEMGVGIATLEIASHKISISFLQAFCRGVGCNWLVCLAIWLSFAGEGPVAKIIGIYFPIMAFVAIGFEHSIANMFFIPLGLVLQASLKELPELTWTNFFFKNLLPVTLGNIIGGAIFVGGLYYRIMQKQDKNAKSKMSLL